MVLKYASQIAALNAAIAKLDVDLASNPQWQALTSKKHLGSVTSNEIDSIFAQLSLEQELARDPVYRARVRLLEAVQVLQQISGETASADKVSGDTGSTQNRTIDAMSSDTMSSARGMRSQTECLTRTSEHEVPKSTTSENASSHESVAATDDLMRIRGVTRSLNEGLKALGTTQFAQIADWTSKDRHKISEQLGIGREISRQNWIEQAALLVAKSASPTDARALAEPAAAQPAIKPVTVPEDVPHVLIKSVAHGLIRRLHASNDTKPVDINTHQSSAKPVSDSPATHVSPAISHQATPLNPQSQIVFSPRIVPEPRRVVADQERQKKEGADLPSGNDVSSQSRAGSEAITKAVPPLETDANLNTRAVKPMLPKDKLRFRRLELKSRPSSGAENSEVYKNVRSERAPPPPVSHHVPMGSDADVVIQKSARRTPTQRPEPAEQQDKSTSPNPLAPPPIPKQRKQAAALKKRRWLRQRALQSARDGGRESFGDGQLWRQPDPILTGPSLNDEATLDSKIYAHTEEASVEIVRARPRAGTASDALPDPPRNASDSDLGAAAVDKTAKSPPRNPAKRIFKALKRE